MDGKKIIPRIAAVGDKNSEHVTNCKICKDNGWPCEPIDFVKMAKCAVMEPMKPHIGS